MVTYKRSSITAKSGVNYLRSIVEASGYLFHPIAADSDFGIDALIEVLPSRGSDGEIVAVQIKSGNSYCNFKTMQCSIPIGNHREYWSEYSLPLYGVVYLPKLKRAYWVDIKDHLARNSEATEIRFFAGRLNLIDGRTFENVFAQHIKGELPRIGFPEALELLSSRHADESYLGLVTLMRTSLDREEAWDALFSYFYHATTQSLHPIIVYCIAHIPGHSDIFYSGPYPGDDIIQYVHGKYLSKFGRKEILRLLELVDEYGLYERGEIGQSVEAVVSCLPQSEALLRQIADDPNLDVQFRAYATQMVKTGPVWNVRQFGTAERVNRRHIESP